MKNKMFYIDKNETIEDILKQIKEFFEYDSGIVCDEKVAYFKEDTFNQLLDYITNLQEENKELGRYYTRANNEFLELKQRIDKVIEYIKEDMYGEPNVLYGLVDGDHLLNILNGDDKYE